MKKQILAFLVALVPALAMAAAPAGKLDHIEPDLYNFESLHNGARLFNEYCLGCHSMQYQRFSRTAEDLGISQQDMEANYILNPQLAYNDHMLSSISAADAEAWFGTPPPDLTLMARLKGADYIYSFLRGFYRDDSKPWGVNNSVFVDVGMPHVLAGLQGEYERVCDPAEAADPRSCYTQVRAGSLSPEAYDQAVYDLTNFMVYVAEPSKYQSDRLAPRVLIFIVIFFIVALLLKKEYWRDVK